MRNPKSLISKYNFSFLILFISLTVSSLSFASDQAIPEKTIGEKPFEGVLYPFSKLSTDINSSKKQMKKILHFADNFFGRHRLSNSSSKLISRLDFDSPTDLYESIPGKRKSTKRLYYLGQGFKDRYYSKLHFRPLRPASSKFYYGDIDGITDLRFGKSNISDGKNFFLKSKGSFFLQDIRFGSLIDIFDASMHYVSFVGGDYNKIESDVKKQLPRTYRYFDRYIKNVGKIVKVGDDDKGSPVFSFDLKFSFRMENLKKDFSKLHDFIDKFKRSLLFNFDLLDNSHRKIFRFKISSKTKTISFYFVASENYFFPFKLPNKGISLQTPIKSLSDRFYMHIRNNLNIFGLKIKFKNFKIRVKNVYASGKEQKSYFKLEKIPDIEQSGSLGGILPGWLINVLIPGSMEDMMKDFFNVLVSGNDGKGAFVIMNTSDLPGQDNIFKLASGAEIYHNGLVDFVMRIISKIWAQYSEGIMQAIDLFAGIINNFKRDFYNLDS